MDISKSLPATSTKPLELDEREETSLRVELICDIFDNTKSEELQFKIIFDKLKDEILEDKLDLLESVLKTELTRLRGKYKSYLDRVARNKARVRKLHIEFMASNLRLPKTILRSKISSLVEETEPENSATIFEQRDITPPPKDERPSTSSKPKRSSDEKWEALTERHKRKKAAELEKSLEDESLGVVALVAERKARAQKKENLAKLLKLAMQSPLRPTKILDSYMKEKVNVTNLTPDAALALILTKNVCKDLYRTLRTLAVSNGLPNYYPKYEEIQKEKKKCRPLEGPTITETEAKISLQALLNHTVSRILEIQDEVLIAYANEEELDSVNLNLKVSWGFDGSTGHSLYKQKMDGPDDDHSLFATTVIPLLLSSSQGFPIWKNKTPQSYRSCRPLSLKFVKESVHVILTEKESVESEISHLQPFQSFTSSGIELHVVYEPLLTVIDGKVFSIISGATSQQSCGICGAKPSEFNKLEKLADRILNRDALAHGISPLHMWIRCFEFILHLGYKNIDGLKTWKVSKQSQILAERKKSIQNAMRQEFGLLVDFPKPGGSGTTNDGNTSRRIFSDSNRRTASEILGIEPWLVDGLHNILVALDSCLPLDAEKFGKFCSDLARRYVEHYGWYYMPVSVHKLLMHGKEIIEASTLPLGMHSEQAGESQNKIYKRYREQHTRKDSKKHTLEDLFN